MGKDFNYLNGGNGLIKAQETIIWGCTRALSDENISSEQLRISLI